MANYAYLSLEEADGPPTYDCQILEGRYFVPLFWLASSRVADCGSFEDEDGELLNYVSLPVTQALEVFQKNTEALVALCPDFADLFEPWRALLWSAGNKHLNIDANEIVFMTDDDDSGLRRAMSYFDQADEASLAELLRFTCFDHVLDGGVMREYAVVDGESLDLTAREYLLGID